MENKSLNEEEKPILIINMDINRTIIFKDKGKGSSLESGIKLSICQEIWGTIDKNTNKWILYSDKICLDPPDDNPELITYYDYLKKINKPKIPKEVPDNTERSIINTKIKKEWEKMTDKFFDKGQPGESLSHKYIEVVKKLKIPDEIINSEECQKLKDLYENNYRFIFSSLFKLMIELQKSGRIFNIIFRTFGNDFSDLSLEFNAFCEGKHPLYKNVYFDGSHNSFDHRIIKETTGSFHRLINDDVNNIYFVVGECEHPNIDSPEDLYKYYDGKIDKNKIIKGGENFFGYIHEFFKNKKNNSFFVSDDYSAWFKHDRKKEYGKPIFFDPNDKKYHFIFFDDNIEKKPTSIVDCKNIKNGKKLDSDDVYRKYLIQVDPIEAAVNDNYFIDKIKEAEKNLK